MGIPPKHRSEVGQRLKELREAWGLSQREMAQRAGGLDRGYYSAIERGATPITTKRIEDIAVQLGIARVWLLHGDGAPEDADSVRDFVSSFDADRRKDIGRRLRQVRDTEGLTQDEMAKRLGLSSRSLYAQYELGDAPISLERVRDFAKRLKLPFEDLAFGAKIRAKDYISAPAVPQNLAPTVSQWKPLRASEALAAREELVQAQLAQLSRAALYRVIESLLHLVQDPEGWARLQATATKKNRHIIDLLADILELEFRRD